MSGSAILVIILSIGMVALIAWASAKSKKQLSNQGKIVERKAMFYEEKAVFSTKASYDSIVSLVSKRDYKEIKATVERESSSAILIKSTLGWNAVLENVGMRDGKNVIAFHFTAWKTEYGRPANEISMNYIMTDIEKTILSLDQSATVERQKMQFKSKTNFI